MSQDFTTRLQLQLREAALREERRGALGRRLTGVRYALPGPSAALAGALAAILVVAVLVAGGLDWGGERTVSKPRVVADVQLSDNLGFVTPGFGSGWIADVKNRGVLRIDPRSRAVIARIPTGGNPNAFGGDPVLNSGLGAIWALTRPLTGPWSLVRIDPATNRSSRVEIRRPGNFAPFDVQIIDGAPWVVGSSGARRFDARTGKPGRFVPIDPSASEPFPLTMSGHGHELWVLTRSRTIERYDLRSGRPTGQLPVRLDQTVGALPTDERLILITRNGELAAADLADGRIEWRRKLGTTITGIPLLHDGKLWAHVSGDDGGRDRLFELDPGTGRVLSSTVLPQFGAIGAAAVGREIWLTTPNGRLMVIA